MEPLDLEAAILNEEFLNKLLEEVIALTHEFLGLLLSQDAVLVNFRHLEVRKDQDEYLLSIP